MHNLSYPPFFCSVFLGGAIHLDKVGYFFCLFHLCNHHLTLCIACCQRNSKCSLNAVSQWLLTAIFFLFNFCCPICPFNCLCNSIINMIMTRTWLVLSGRSWKTTGLESDPTRHHFWIHWNDLTHQSLLLGLIHPHDIGILKKFDCLFYLLTLIWPFVLDAFGASLHILFWVFLRYFFELMVEFVILSSTLFLHFICLFLQVCSCWFYCFSTSRCKRCVSRDRENVKVQWLWMVC